MQKLPHTLLHDSEPPSPEHIFHFHSLLNSCLLRETSKAHQYGPYKINSYQPHVRHDVGHLTNSLLYFSQHLKLPNRMLSPYADEFCPVVPGSKWPGRTQPQVCLNPKPMLFHYTLWAKEKIFLSVPLTPPPRRGERGKKERKREEVEVGGREGGEGKKERKLREKTSPREF